MGNNECGNEPRGTGLSTAKVMNLMNFRDCGGRRIFTAEHDRRDRASVAGTW
jgi:hypothetical protein